MATLRVKRRPGLVLPLVFAAAASIVLPPREAGAQSRSGSAALSVSVTVVRGCLVDTSAAGGVGVTCSQTTAAERLQLPAGAAAPSPGGTRDSTYTVTKAADGRVVIQF